MAETPTLTVRSEGLPITPRMKFFGLTAAVQVDDGWIVGNDTSSTHVPKHVGDWLTER